jgi:uncharacterized protein
MKMFRIAAPCFALCLALAASGLAQTADTDPATKDQVELLLRTTQSHDMMHRMMEGMLKPMHQMFRDQFEKDGKQLPPDFESRANKMFDELIKNMPMDEMVQAMVPAYQKHFTNGDVNNLIAFYSSPTGQKVLQEMPEVTSEGMQAMMPIMTKYMKDAQERVQQQVKDMEKSAPKTEDSAVQQ